MASDLNFVEFVVDQFHKDLGVTHKKMFGEFGLFSGGKMFAMVCDDRLLVKPTAGGRAFIGEPAEAEPYPGAKPCFLIEDRIEDPDWLSELVRVTVPELPTPKPKPTKAKGKKKG